MGTARVNGRRTLWALVMVRRALGCLAGAALCAAALGGCVHNEATGKSVLAFMSKSQEIALGAQAAPEFTAQFGGEVTDERLRAYVDRIGQSMAVYAEGGYNEVQWTFTLLNSPVVNAFALPGGKVFFSRGLAEKLTSEAEMAGVIGHEIGHVTAQHGNQRMSSAMVLQGLIAGAAIAVGTADDDSDFRKWGQVGIPALMVGGQLVLLKFGREEELEADRLGVRYMTKAGYNPRGQKMVMEVLRDLSKGGGQPDILSTHPNPADRVRQIEDMLRGEYAFTQNNGQYQMFEDRYAREYLTISRSLPPAPQPTGMLPGSGGEGTLRRRGVLGPTAAWCLTCQRSTLSKGERSRLARQ